MDSRNVVWRDLLDMALSEFINVAVSRQVDRWLATKASMMDLPVDGATAEELERVKLLRTAILHSLGSSRALEGWEATFLLQTIRVRYLRRRYGNIKAAEVMLLDSLEWFQEQRHWEDWLRKHEVEDSLQHKALFHKYGAEGPSGLGKLDVPMLYVKAGIQDTVGTMRETSVEVHMRPLVWNLEDNGNKYYYDVSGTNTGQNYDIDDVVADDLTSAFSSNLNRVATELSDSVFVSLLAPIPKTRSNATNDSDLNRILLRNSILSCSCPGCPRILTTSPNKRQIRSVQQSFGRIVDIEDNIEENDNTPEESHEVIYVKTINGKTISARHHKNMTAAVILDEVERRSLIPRDMIRLVHKGKMISAKKSMKENNIEAKETIEMSLRLLGGMEVNEQMDTHETEEDREKNRKLDEGKEGKMTKPNDDMAHLKRDIMEALRRSDEKMDSYSRKTDEKMECYSRKTDEKIESYSKKTEERMNDFSRKADELLEKFMLITNTVGNQIQGINSSIVKLQETNEKMKEDGENKFNQFDERIMDMERKILDMDKKNMSTEAKITSRNM